MQGSGGSFCFGASRTSDEYGGADRNLTVVEVAAGRVSDVHMACRKAEEAAARRAMAATWITKMVPSAKIPVEPTEDELRGCLKNGAILCRLINRIEPTAVSKVVESTSTDGSQSAFQYFENLRNFLVAAQEMRLPTFEICDLEQVTGHMTKVVDCILALKSYNEWKQTGALGSWKYAGSLRSPLRGNVYPRGHGRPGQADLTSKKTSRKRLLPPDSYAEAQPPLTDEATGLVGCKGQSYEADPEADIENRHRDSTSAWINELAGKFRDLLKVKPLQDTVLSENYSAVNGVESFTLSAVVKNMLDGKQPDEVPALVELMIKQTVVELQQGQQLDKINPINAVERLKDSKFEQSLIAAMEEIKLLRRDNERLKEEAVTTKQIWQDNMQCIGSRLVELATDAAGYRGALAENRRLYNEVQDLKGNIRVYCRVRPSSDAGSVEFIGENGEIMISNKDSSKSFCFNKIFGPTATQESVYLDTQPLIRSVLDGFNVCIFAYGQTGSGKTYTMSGPENLSEETWGVNYRALHDLFQLSFDRQKMFRYEIVVQFLEIYNEQLRDLLAPDTGSKKLEIRNSSQKYGINVPDAVMMPVNSTNDVMQLMKMGQKNRAVGSTAMNERSSRSHSVLTVHVRGTDCGTGAILHGSLHLVDLAGSERVDKSEATGDRLKEAQHINKSLAALGDVIAALSTKNSHIPYRNSKLTQLLQDSLGGQAKALMFVHMSPEIDSYNETLSTLKFAERVATVELGAARSNRESSDVRTLKDQVAALKDALNKKDVELENLRATSALKLKSTAARRLSVSGGENASCSPEGDVFESCVSSGSSCPPLTRTSSPTSQRILREKALNSKSTMSSTKQKPKLTEVVSSQKLLRRSAFLKYPDQNSETGQLSPASIKKPQGSQQWRTPLQASKLKSADPRRSCVDLGRRYSSIGLPADSSSVKRPSLGSNESTAAESSIKPALARHLFANQATKPTKS